MKEKVHPKYHKITASCACGAHFETGSTKETIRVDICSNCHPFYTGVQKIVDAAGRVEKFNKKYNR
jgi:large subunit ribosomal protein L31